MNLYTKTFANEDNAGNKVYMRIFFDEKDERQSANIHLKLKEERSPRMLGSFDFTTRTFYCKRSTAKHLHRKSKSFGFNWTILNDAFLSVENVYIILDDTDHYCFPISLIKDYGQFLNFKQQGFELQRFMSFELIKRYSKIPKNPNGNIQKGGDKPEDSPEN
jgi:hypothetical protein